LQHLLHGFEAVGREDTDAPVERHEFDAGAVGDDDRIALVFAFDRVLRTNECEHRIWVVDDPHARTAIELFEGVVAVVEIRSRHVSTVLLCAPMAVDQVNLGLLLLCVAVSGTMMAHGYNHVFRGGKIAGTGRWFESLGMKPGKLHAWLASGPALAAGAGLVLGLLTPLAAGALIGVVLVAFITNHLRAGFFVFRRPTEGWEYLMNLAAALFAL